MNLNDDPRGGTMCHSKAGLAEGTNANTIKVAAPVGAGVDFSINGYSYHYADGDNIAMTALAVQADLTTCLYGVFVDANLALSIVKGNEALTGSGDPLYWPAPPANKCPFGGFKIVNSAGTFTSGSTDLGAGTVTDTFYDFMCVPTAPIAA